MLKQQEEGAQMEVKEVLVLMSAEPSGPDSEDQE